MVVGFMVITDFPTVKDPSGALNSHGFVRDVRVCDCPKVVHKFGPDERADADALAAVISHSVVLPIRDR